MRCSRCALWFRTPHSALSSLSAEVLAGGGEASQVGPFVPEPAERDDYLHDAFEPLSVLTCVVSVSYAIDRLTRTIRAVRHGGVVVDTREAEIEIREHPALSAGSVIVVTKEGAQHFKADTPIDVSGIFEALLRHR